MQTRHFLGGWNLHAARSRTRPVAPTRRGICHIEALEPRQLLSGDTIFVSNPNAGTIGEYTTSGATVNASLITGLHNPVGIAVLGSDIFVVNAASNTAAIGTIGEYTTSGATVNASLLRVQGAGWIAASGNDLFITNAAGAGNNTLAGLGEYTTSGATVNAKLLVIGADAAFVVGGVVISGSDLFIAGNTLTGGYIEEYTTAGDYVNAALVPLQNDAFTEGIAVTDTDIYAPDNINDTVTDYSIANGMQVGNAIQNLAAPEAVAVDGSNLFIYSVGTDGTTGTIGEYTTAGVTVNASLISGIIGGPGAIVISDGSSGSVAPTLVVPTLGKVALPTSVVAGTKTVAKAPVVVTNQGTEVSGKVTVNLYADTTAALDGNQTLLASSTRNVVLKTNKTSMFSFVVRSLPATLPAGNYYLVAQVTDPSGATNVTATAQTIAVAAPVIQPVLTVNSVTPAAIAPGRVGSLLVTIGNTGNIPAPGLDLTLGLSADGTTPVAGVILETVKSGVSIPPGRSKTFRLRFKVSSILTAGTYFPYLSLTLDGVAITQVGATAFTIG